MTGTTSTLQRLRVVLVEDSMLLREGLVRLFDEAGYETIAALPDATDVVAVVKAAAPDLVITDVRLPPSFRDEGIRAALELRKRFPAVAILVLSQYVETVYAAELVEAAGGGVGYLLKDRLTSLGEFQRAVEQVCSGGTVLDPDVVRRLLASSRNPLAALTPREREVLEPIASGRSNQSIAQQLVVSLGAVEKHVTSIFGKLELFDTPEDHRRVLAVLRYLKSAT